MLQLLEGPMYNVSRFMYKHDCRKELGSLRLKVQCSEERILEASLYEPFVKLMLDAVEHPTVGAACIRVPHNYVGQRMVCSVEQRYERLVRW